MFNIQAKTSNKDNINNSFPIKSILMINILKSSISTACANTILAPLNRLKILMQVMNKISINDSEKEYKIRKLVPKIVSDQGFYSLWRGNLASCYKILIQATSRVFLYEHLNLINLSSNSNDNTTFAFKFINSFISSSIVLAISYPLELASTRMAGDMTRYGHKRIYSSIPDLFSKLIFEDNIRSNFALAKFYKGFTFSILGNLPYSIMTLISFDYFIKNRKPKFELKDSFFHKYKTLFGVSVITNTLTSVVIYPFDTLKRRFQVNGGIGFSNQVMTLSNELTIILSNPKGFLNLYSGYSMHLLRLMPYSFINYLCYFSYLSYFK